MPESITYSSGKNSTPSAAATGISATSGAASQAASLGGFREAVCLNAGRVYDSCSSKDCLEDLRVYMTAPCQALLDSCSSVRCRSVDVLHVAMDVDSVPFNNGYYSVDMTFYFLITLDASGTNGSGSACGSQTVEGIATFSKKVILFGSEGSVRSFKSGDCIPCALTSDAPTAQVQTVDPICLGLKLCDQPKPECGCESIPAELESLLGGPVVTQAARYLYVTVGLFSIVSLERQLEMMVPVYDFCIPEKECVSASAEDPCELFKKIRFPVNEFFPPKDCGCD
ncbi:MAG TPA: hypothetical protein IAB37_06310 [Candidatus Faecivivens stercoravium]|uniref:Uncharacterized protein n=1 Tax=Candidatus Faecivivens stercoravium TaxID=2840803 RepID=A0A9D1DY47_9FIRM|nr:hypothetical protein [Candidatus Faecivivens stercoravium]